MPFRLTGSWSGAGFGLLFGGCFCRWRYSPRRWCAQHRACAVGGSISAFTIVFAAGQIVGPTVVGLIADGPGGLAQAWCFGRCARGWGAAGMAHSVRSGRVTAVTMSRASRSGGAAVVHDGLVGGRLHHGDEGVARGYSTSSTSSQVSPGRDEGMVGIGQPD